MSNDLALALISHAKRKADESVDYTSKNGALCPECGLKMRVITSRAWEDEFKVRFHKCLNEKCILGALGISMKSVQVDG